jgi:uncharacterized protein (UPF0303 family)
MPTHDRAHDLQRGSPVEVRERGRAALGLEVAEHARTLAVTVHAWTTISSHDSRPRRRSCSSTLDIRRGEQQLFHYALPGTAADNDGWIERKNRVVRRFGHSTLYMRAAEGDAFAENYLLDPALFAAHGGAFPVVVRDVGVVGTVTVSGLPQEEDHRLVVSVLRAFLTRDEP